MAGHSAILGGDCTDTVDSCHGLEMYVFVLNMTIYFYYRENLMTPVENGH